MVAGGPMQATLVAVDDGDGDDDDDDDDDVPEATLLGGRFTQDAAQARCGGTARMRGWTLPESWG